MQNNKSQFVGQKNYPPKGKHDMLNNSFRRVFLSQKTSLRDVSIRGRFCFYEFKKILDVPNRLLFSVFSSCGSGQAWSQVCGYYPENTQCPYRFTVGEKKDAPAVKTVGASARRSQYFKDTLAFAGVSFF